MTGIPDPVEVVDCLSRHIALQNDFEIDEIFSFESEMFISQISASKNHQVSVDDKHL